MTQIAILVPTLNRPGKLAWLVGNIHATTPTASVYFIVEAEDAATQQALLELEHQNMMIGSFGSYAVSINWAYRHTSEPLLFAGADDVRFTSGWFEAIKAKLEEGAEVVGTNDLGNPAVLNESHATHYLVTRRYLDEQGGVFDGGPGTFLPECYDHNYTDTEFIETAKLRGVFAPCLESVVEHEHPAWGKAEMDATYDKSFVGAEADKRIYQKRRVAWEAG